MMHQRGQPDYSGILIVGILFAILIILLIILWRSDFGRFYFYLFQFLLHQ